MKQNRFREILEEEINIFFKSNLYSLEDELILENEIILGEMLDISDYYPYEGLKGLYTYKDDNGDEFFVRLAYQPIGSNPFFELKTGWLDENGKAHYEPSTPPYSPKSSSIYLQKRSNTLAKIFKDELIPFFEQQNLSNIIIIKPISASRSRFSRIMLNKLVPKNKFNVNLDELTITKK